MKIKINYTNIIYIFLILPFFKPSAFVNYAFLDNLLDLLRVISMLLAIIYLIIIFLAKKKLMISNVQTIMWFYTIYMLFITVFNSSSLNQWVLVCLAPAALIFWIERWSSRNYISCLKFLYITFGLLTISNLIILLLFGSDGLYIDTYGSAVYLLGMRTRWADVFFPLLALIALMSSRTNNHKIFVKLFSIVCLFGIVYQIVNQWVATAILGIFILLVIIAFIYFTRIKISLIKLFWTSIVINVAIVFFRIQDAFSWIITVLLHKDVGLNSRTMIWDSALNIISENPMFGHGITNNTSFVPLYGGKLIAQGHSILIQLLHDGGVIALVLFFAVLLVFILKINKTKKFDIYFCGLVLIILIILGVSEIYFYHIYIYSIIGLICGLLKNNKEDCYENVKYSNSNI